MESAGEKDDGQLRRAPGFPTTRWSIVVAAGVQDSTTSRDALAELCATYWYPLYVFARRRGHSIEQAEDLTQGFFARFLEKNDVQCAEPTRGKFRSFLLTTFKHFLANDWDQSQAQKRGGKFTIIPLDTVMAEGKYGLSLAHGRTPDQDFERQWALILLEETVAQLSREYTAAGKEVAFEQLRAFLPGSNANLTIRTCAVALSSTEAAVKMAVHRLRARYRKVLRQRVADTLENQDSVDDEIRYLLEILGS